MPNPKTGTVTFEVGKAISEIRKGRVEFKVEKAGIVQVPVGKCRSKPRSCMTMRMLCGIGDESQAGIL